MYLGDNCISRRHMMALLGGITGIAVTNLALSSTQTLHENIYKIGTAILESNKVTADLDSLVDTLKQKIDINAHISEVVVQTVQVQARSDFKKNSIIHVDGIALSQTEAEVFAYFTLLHDISKARI